MAVKSSVAGFPNIKSAIRFYVIERLETITVKFDCPPRINVSEHFVAFLVERDVDETVAVDIASDQGLLLMDEVGRQIDRWKQQGVTPPFDRVTDDDGALVTWRHSHYETHTGSPAPGRDFLDIYVTAPQTPSAASRTIHGC